MINVFLLSQAVYLPLIIPWLAKIVAIVEAIILYNILISEILGVSSDYLDVLFK